MINSTITARYFRFKKVFNQRGREIGVIEDVIINESSREIMYVMMKMRGLMGFGDKRIPMLISPEICRFDANGHLKLNIDRQQLKRIQKVEPEQLHNLDFYQVLIDLIAHFDVNITVTNDIQLVSIFDTSAVARNISFAAIPMMKANKQSA